MNKIAICTKDKSHDSFLVNVTVVQRWSVDREGDPNSVVDDSVEIIEDVVDAYNEECRWECEECGSQARFVSHDEWERIKKQREAVDTAFVHFRDVATGFESAQTVCYAVNAALELDLDGMKRVLAQLESHRDRLQKKAAR
jgi:hypothetical protein